MVSLTVSRDDNGQHAVYRLSGAFDRAGAWSLRDRLERDGARELILDFSLVREFSDLAVAVLAHGLTTSRRAVALRGVQQHQLRIFQYCGVPIVEASAALQPDTVVEPPGAMR